MDWRKYHKIELHRHFEGAIRLQTVLDVAAEAGVKLPANNIKDLEPYALVTKPMKDLSVVLAKMWVTQSILASESILERTMFECLEDAYNDGIRTLEVRYSPGFINTNHPKLTYEKIKNAIVKGHQKAVKKYPDLKVGFICTISRDLSMKDAEESADFAISHKDHFCGFDLAGDEVGFPAVNFKHLFQKVKKQGLGITVHSGEARAPGSAETVADAIKYLGADRIGHGVQIAHSSKIMDFVKSENVLLEVCPTSNYITQAFNTLEEHPIRKLIDYGVKISLNSDDPHFFGIDLTNEYEMLAQLHKFTKNDFDELNKNALEFSFIKKKVLND